MNITPLQKLALAQAEELASSLQGQIHSLARKYDFGGALCTRNTPENELLHTANKISDIMNALKAER